MYEPESPPPVTASPDAGDVPILTSPDTVDAPIPGLLHLSGSRRGTAETLVEDVVRIGTGRDTEIHLPADREPAVAPHHATLYRRGQTYRLWAEKGQSVWVNDDLVDDWVLANGDVVRLGAGGPRLRYRVLKQGQPGYRSVAEVIADCVDCAQEEGATALDQAAIFLRTAPAELASQTSPRFRWMSLVLVAAMGITFGTLAFRFDKRLDRQQVDVSGIADLIHKAKSEALTPGDLNEVRSELDARVSGTLERLDLLEERAGAAPRVISTAAESIVFLQGSYGFVEQESGKPLRFLLGPDGGPVLDPSGMPGITIEGEGPVLESQFTGTGFVATDDGLILTNRHVAVPWDFDDTAQAMASQGLTPTLFRFVGYLKDVPEAFELELVAASDDADVAVLKCDEVTSRVQPLRLAETPPAPGDEVIVLGYPTGIRALLARTDVDFVSELMSAGNVDFWNVAQRLAESGHIAPLATRGIIGQVTPAAVVYDAETTSGGSGGPVVNLRGEVIAVNMAILPEFGGSNLGVPIDKAREILPAADGAEADTAYLPVVDYPVP